MCLILARHFFNNSVKYMLKVCDNYNIIDYYNEYELYSHTPNRKHHIPYIFKALIMDNPKQIGEEVECHVGKN